MASPNHERFRAYLEQEIAQTRSMIARQMRRFGAPDVERIVRSIRPLDVERIVRRNSKRRPPGMAPALVEPPRGPQPLQGGAAAPLDFS